MASSIDLFNTKFNKLILIYFLLWNPEKSTKLVQIMKIQPKISPNLTTINLSQNETKIMP